MKLFLLFSFLMLFVFYSYAQEKKDSISVDLNFNKGFLKLEDRLSEIDFYIELKSIEKEIAFTGDEETIWLWTYMSLKHSPDNLRNDNLPSHISLPLLRQYIEDSKFNPVRMALGMAQLGATGYLAYKSIKKYGLFK